jgi:hypothetical protein
MMTKEITELNETVSKCDAVISYVDAVARRKAATMDGAMLWSLERRLDAYRALLARAQEALRETLKVATRNEEGDFADHARLVAADIAAALKGDASEEIR